MPHADDGRGLIARLIETYSRCEFRRADFAPAPRRGAKAVFFHGTRRDGGAEVREADADPTELAHRVLGDRPRLKRCLTCQGPRPVSQFSKHGGTRDGLSRDCKLCEARRLRAYRRRPDAPPPGATQGEFDFDGGPA